MMTGIIAVTIAIVVDMVAAASRGAMTATTGITIARIAVTSPIAATRGAALPMLA